MGPIPHRHYYGGDVQVLQGAGSTAHQTLHCVTNEYRKLFDIRRSKSQNLHESRLVLQLSLPNPLKPGAKSRLKMYM